MSETRSYGGMSPALASALMDFVSEAIVFSDEEGRVVVASAAAQRLLGRNQADLAGISLEELFPDSVATIRAMSKTHAGDAPVHAIRSLRIGSELVPTEVTAMRLPDGGIIAFAVSIRDAFADRRPRGASALGRYDAFLEEIAHFIARGVEDDRIDGLAALIAAALEIGAVAVVVFTASDEPVSYLHGCPETIARALFTCFALQAPRSDFRPLLLADMDGPHRLFVSAALRTEFRDAAVVDLSLRDQRLGLLTALSRSTERFDGPAQDFLARAAAMLVQAISRDS